jgi:hypothetical protein
VEALASTDDLKAELRDLRAEVRRSAVIMRWWIAGMLLGQGIGTAALTAALVRWLS